MITLEQFSIIHMKMALATGNSQQEQAICNEHGISMEQWLADKAHYYAKMSDPADGGKTAMAMSSAAMNNMHSIKIPAQENKLPHDFHANNIQIYLNENQVQMVEFLTGKQHEHVVLQHFPKEDPNDEFMMNYVKGRAHISICDASYNIYGGVSNVELSSKSIKFIFDAEGAERMQCTSVTVTYDISGKKYKHLKSIILHMYKNLVNVSNENDNEVYTIGNNTYDLRWENFNNDGNIAIRPNLANLKSSGHYPIVVLPAFRKGVVGDPVQEKKLFDAMVEALLNVLESDMESVMAFHLETNELYRLFIYTHLDQAKFMADINEALVYLPQLPLEFDGGDDSPWNNYTEVMKDYMTFK